jgi:hypothetical protein
MISLVTPSGQPTDSMEGIEKELRVIGQKWDNDGFISDKWSLHHIMHRVLIRIINPGAYEADVIGCNDYLVNSPGTWNYAPKILVESKHDLSQPTVDTCFAISMAQASFHDPAKDPLPRICDKIQKLEYRCSPLKSHHFKSDFGRAAELLSLDTLNKLNEYQSLAEVSKAASTWIRLY